MKKKLFIAFSIFIFAGLALFYILTMGDVGVTYDTAKAEKIESSIFVHDTGRISSKNIRKYYANGINQVETLPVTLGDHVKKGQLLVKYKDNLKSIDLQIQKVNKQIEALEATYAEALSNKDKNSISSARIEINRTKKNISKAEADHEKNEILYNEGAISLSEYEGSLDKIEEEKSALGIAQNTYNKLSKGISENVREKYEAEIDVLLLTIDILEESKDDFAIYADTDAIVTQLNTFEGDKPSAGHVIIELMDPSEKIILVDFMVEDAIEISMGLEAKVMDYDLGINIENLVVKQIYPKAFVSLSELGVRENRQTVSIDLPKDNNSLPFGLEIETMVVVDSDKTILLIPKGAIIEKNSKQYTEVLVNGKPVEREIETGKNLNGRVEVFSGVKEGEEVILNYQED